MRILVWGLGYVGSVTAACLARFGHTVVGIEPNVTKVDAINSRSCAVKEPGLEALISEGVGAGRLTAVTHGAREVRDADLSFICVGTPSAADGRQVDEYLRNVAVEIGRGLRDTRHYHVVAVRSTVFPGTTRNMLGPVLEQQSGRDMGRHFGLVHNPEFLREATALSDFADPPYTAIGQLDRRSGDVVAEVYQSVSAAVHRVALEEAEVLKLVNNCFHALKIGFANEIGRLCESLALDSVAIMRLVCADTKLNLSAAYLKPGFAFGGSCLPKDVRSLAFGARRLGAELPIIEALLPSNRLQIEAVRVRVHDLGVRSVAVLGLSFKPGTDDLRESPMIALIRDLWQDGVDVVVHDPDVQPERMLGSNRAYLERHLPQIGEILRSDLDGALRGCEGVIVTQKRSEFLSAIRRLDPHIDVIDLVHLSDRPLRRRAPPPYRRISWPQIRAHVG